MPKNLIVCADGTGNTGGKIRGTNVWKTYKAVDLVGPFKNGITEQRAIHDDGVGTEKFLPLKVLGGALGLGFTKNVKDLYKFLVYNFEANDDVQDKIYLFGFSRGAYTVRALAGLITTFGILNGSSYENDEDLEGDIKKIIACVRRAKAKESYDDILETLKHQPHTGVKVEFIGVWDTVSALGGPWTQDVLKPDQKPNILKRYLEYFSPFKFHNDELNEDVLHAFHALSIDDARKGFQPRIWDETRESKDTNRIEQVWFPGVHSNVGGGYPRHGLSDVALYWMMQKADKHDLQFYPGSINAAKDEADPHGRLYDSRSGLAAVYRYKPRDIEEECDKKGCAVRIHDSAKVRIHQRTAGYAPCNFPLSVTFEADNGTPSNTLASDENKLAAVDRVNRERARLYWYFLLLTVLTVAFIAVTSFPQLVDLTKDIIAGDTISAVKQTVGNIGLPLSIAIAAVFGLLFLDKRRLENKQAIVSQQAWWQ